MNSISTREIQEQISTLQIAERFFDSAVLFALFELGVFRILSADAASLSDLHERIGGNEESLRATLDAGVALAIISKRGEEYKATETLLTCLGREESPAYIGEWITFLHALASPLLKLPEAVRTGKPPETRSEEVGQDSLPMLRMTRAMDAYARSRGMELVDRLDLSDIQTLLDIGCGPGTYSLAIAERFPSTKATLLDLPGPIAETRELAQERGLSNRVEFIAADLMSWVPKHRYDAVLISNTLHMLGPSLSLELLKRCFSMINPGGRIIVQAQYLEEDRTSPRWPTLLNLIQRVITLHGRNHTLGETSEWLRLAGFAEIEHVPLSIWNVNSVLIGHRTD